MQSNESLVNAINLHTLHQLSGEVETSSWSSYSTFLLCKYALEVVHIILCSVMHLTVINHITRQWSLTQCKERLLEDIMLTFFIIEETKGTTTAGGIIDNLSYHLVHIVKEQLVANTNLAGRLYEYIPKTHLRIQFTEQEHFNLGISLLLGTIKTGWENLGVIEYKGITLGKVVDNILELQVYRIAVGIHHILAFLILLIHLNGFRLLMEHHETRLVTASHLEYTFSTCCLNHTSCFMWIKCHLLFWQLEIEL